MGIVTKPLRIVYWNANDTSRDYDILTEFLEEYDVDIGLFLINETHLTASKRFTIKNYSIY